MRVGYMTNGFGPLVGSGGGVTSVKDIRYLTMCDDEEAVRKITSVGFQYIEVLEGNLTQYEKAPQKLKNLLKKYNAGLMSVCVGANFIYQDALEDEMYHIDTVSKMAADMGARYIVLCGGAIRAKGVQDGDYALLGKGLDMAKSVIEKHGLVACYHPHLGSMAETPEQIDRLFSHTKIAMCPDMAHLQAGGSDPLEIVKKYYDRIAFVHLKDLNEQGFAPLGTGKVALQEIINYIKYRGYNGDWLVEIDGYSGDSYEACKTSYEYLKGILV